MSKNKESASLALNQLSMDLFCEPESPDTDTTRSLKIYDLAPKFKHDNIRPVLLSKAGPASFSTSFSIKDRMFDVTVRAAIIKEDDGLEYLVFPSGREELVEAAIRKMALSGHAFNHNGSFGAQFSIYQLQKELAAFGHDANYTSIKRSIIILQRSGLGITDKETGATWEENFFPQLGTGGWSEKPGSEYTPWFVSFHKLVTDNIVKLEYRDLNYRSIMSTKGMLARHILQRMTNLYTFANPKKPYRPSRNLILEGSGWGLNAPSNRLTERVNRALDQLMKLDIVSHWEIEGKTKQGRKVTNVMYAIYPTKKFTHETVKANDAEKGRRRKLNQSKLKEIQNSID